MLWLFNIFFPLWSPWILIRIPNPDPEDPWIRIRNAAYRYYRYCITIETWGICFSGGRIWFLFIPACSTLTAVNICLKNTSGFRSPVISAPPAPQHWIGVLNVYKIAKKNKNIWALKIILFVSFFRTVSIPENYVAKRPGWEPACSAGRSAEDDTLDLAKSYFDLKEYDRAAFFAKNLPSSAGEHFQPVLLIQIHWIWIPIANFGPIWIRFRIQVRFRGCGINFERNNFLYISTYIW